MNVKRKLLLLTLPLVSMFVLMGCAVRREANGIEISGGDKRETENTGKVFRVQRSSVELGEIIDILFGITAEEAQEYFFDKSNVYEKDGTTLIVRSGNYRLPTLTKDEQVDSVMYWDDNEGAFSCYSMIVEAKIAEGLNNQTMRQLFPEEELDSCTKEEAIEACHPYAEALGYGEAAVSVYAVTLDILEKNARQSYFGSGEAGYYGAPGPGFEVVTRRQIDDLKENGRQDEAEQLTEYLNTAASNRRIPWEKKHEALVLIYQPDLEGTVMAESYELLKMLYVPLYECPVIIEGEMPYEAIETVDEQPLISKEDALAHVFLTKGYASDAAIEVEEIFLVYALQMAAEGEDLWEKAVPCWSVDYQYQGKSYRVLIDAIYGDEYVRYPEY